MRILKVIGLLLEYPDELLWENRDDALALIRADVPSLTPFVGELLTAPLLDRQAEWCEVFERGRATSLLLFEHVHAESRDRGQAMVDLMNQYQQAGLQIGLSRAARPSAAVSGVSQYSTSRGGSGGAAEYRADSGADRRPS
ncbi:respiratory nitrate reductase subunit delta [Klebsiella pneumoniae]|nr:respiratory nitrate reductase subunit delta [Klebsiella pneumoniae]